MATSLERKRGRQKKEARALLTSNRLQQRLGSMEGEEGAWEEGNEQEEDHPVLGLHPPERLTRTDKL